MIKAIETEYAGCRFRSRLEARWAVFFDALGVEWEHEPEGFETDAGRYLPDFRIWIQHPPVSKVMITVGKNDHSWPLWFEVKPPDFTHDIRHQAFVESGEWLVVAAGMPRDYKDQLRGHMYVFDPTPSPEFGPAPIFWFYQGGERHVDRAYKAARSERFGT